MQFIKTHLISLLCAVAGLAFLGVTAWGMMVTSVKDELKKRVSAAAVIRTLQASPKNQDLIDAEKLRGEKFQAEFVATVAIAKEINRRAPLMEGAFPKPDTLSTRFEFQERYRRALRGFSVTLLAGGLPTQSEIDDEVENVEDLQAMEAEMEAENEPKDDEDREGRPRRRTPTRRQLRRTRNVGPRSGPFGEGIGGPFGEGMISEGGHGGHGGPAFPSRGAQNRFGRAAPVRNYRAPTGEPKYDPQFRALVAKARSIRCYAEPLEAFHVSPIRTKESAPTPQEMWEAQVGIWIQQDVVEAIAEMNNRAALEVRDGDAFVEQMPVKRIESLLVHGYMLPKDSEQGSYYPFEASGGNNRSAGEPPPISFTGREPDDQFDVIHFTITVFVDQRELLTLIDDISRKNFYKSVELEYRKLNPEDVAPGYMYGTGPVVRAKIRFEGYMARPLYAPMMPKEVRVILGIEKDNG